MTPPVLYGLVFTLLFLLGVLCLFDTSRRVIKDLVQATASLVVSIGGMRYAQTRLETSESEVMALMMQLCVLVATAFLIYGVYLYWVRIIAPLYAYFEQKHAGK